ncbi:response regulator transcription factor [Variovorax guangxiensis]|uniref:response regulator transcription factor n=1 Tax=Variovorax guangxiensis TaxID=1775474 RepID=UPI00285FD4BB|nr:response regulator transcription factor [Variovorax guangxiensis]MDR6859588.1 DNA-binding NarL/FixJ family response regulator [Variovorax guangxiensis]
MISIGIADDHAIARLGMRQFLAECVDFSVVGEASNGSEVVDLVRRTKVDVLIMDLDMPGQSGFEALSRIRTAAPEVAVLIYTGYPQEQFAATMFQYGAKAFLSKDGDPTEVERAIRELALGRLHITPAIADLIADRLAHRSTAPHDLLTERELQVFLRLASGMTPGAIASVMSLSSKTISFYRARVMVKLGLSTPSDLTYYAMKHQLPHLRPSQIRRHPRTEVSGPKKWPSM